MTSKMINLFVYGTLKKGYSNHEKYLCNSLFMGTYKTTLKYPLVIAGKRFSPVLIPEEGIGHYVIGEMYKVNLDILDKVDELESVGKLYGYSRNTIRVTCLENKNTEYCHAYFKRREKLDIIHSGYLEKYSDSRYKCR